MSTNDFGGSAGFDGLGGFQGEGVLNRLRQWLDTYICVMNPADLDLLTLWTAHTYLVKETYTTPRLLIDSPVPESGKTTVIEHLDHLSFQPLQMASISSPALITRMLDRGIRTILIDEADRVLDPNKPEIGDLLAVLNSGYKRGASRPVLVPAPGGFEPVEMPTFAPVAMAGNQPKLPDDTLSRTIRVLLMPDYEGRIEDSDWELIEDEAANIAGELQTWADSVRDTVRDGPRPELPKGARSRFKEKWLPLKRVAVAAGGRWPDVVDELVKVDMETARLNREEGLLSEKLHVVLLRNIAAVWPKDYKFITSADLIMRLMNTFYEAWGPNDKYKKGLTPQRLGRMLVNNFGVRTDKDSGDVRGYFAKDFNAALRALRMPPLGEPPEPPEPSEPP